MTAWGLLSATSDRALSPDSGSGLRVPGETPRAGRAPKASLSYTGAGGGGCPCQSILTILGWEQLATMRPGAELQKEA